MVERHGATSEFAILHRFQSAEACRADHMLRRIDGVSDLKFVCEEVKDRYGYKGDVSVAPPVIVKLMLLLVLFARRPPWHISQYTVLLDEEVRAAVLRAKKCRPPLVVDCKHRLGESSCWTVDFSGSGREDGGES